MQTLPVLQSVSYMQAKAGAEQRQNIVAMIRRRMAVPLEPPKNHTIKCLNLDRTPFQGNQGAISTFEEMQAFFRAVAPINAKH